jgi:hypothetical protein
LLHRSENLESKEKNQMARRRELILPSGNRKPFVPGKFISQPRTYLHSSGTPKLRESSKGEFKSFDAVLNLITGRHNNHKRNFNFPEPDPGLSALHISRATQVRPTLTRDLPVHLLRRTANLQKPLGRPREHAQGTPRNPYNSSAH